MDEEKYIELILNVAEDSRSFDEIGWDLLHEVEEMPRKDREFVSTTEAMLNKRHGHWEVSVYYYARRIPLAKEGSTLFPPASVILAMEEPLNDYESCFIEKDFHN